MVIPYGAMAILYGAMAIPYGAMAIPYGARGLRDRATAVCGTVLRNVQYCDSIGCYAICGTETAYDATRYAVLR
eukprot:3066454-Rhodomonas_salina.1